MSRFFKYCILQFPANALRNERLNLALVVFRDDGLDVRPSRNFDKLKAISAAIDQEQVRASVYQLRDLDSYARKVGAVDIFDRRRMLDSFVSFEFSDFGDFVAPTAEQYEFQLKHLLTTLVEPEPAASRVMRKRPTSLRNNVKLALQAERVLAQKGEGLETHRIVTNHQIAEGLSADFLLKNGAMHVVETVDVSANESPLRRAISDIAVSALVFEQARMTYGQSSTKTKLVYHASANFEKAIEPSLYAAQHQGAVLINWSSQDDRRKFVVEFASLATPLQNKRDKVPYIHASTQPKLLIN